jgi:hypothetical protein
VGDVPLRLWVHPDLFRFDVRGPGGAIRCGLARALRTPLRQSFVLLRPRRRMAMALDLADYCPPGTFDRPGVYDVAPAFEATEAGTPMGLGAFTGLVGGTPVAVRVAVGDRSVYEPDLPGEGP